MASISEVFLNCAKPEKNASKGTKVAAITEAPFPGGLLP